MAHIIEIRKRLAVPVTLDRERTLRYDHVAIEAIERDTGKPLGVALAGGYMSDWLTIIWRGLLIDDPELRRSTLGDILDPVAISQVMEGPVAEAMQNQAADNEKPDPNPAAVNPAV